MAKKYAEEPLHFDYGAEWKVFDLTKEGIPYVPIFAHGYYREARCGVDMHVHRNFVEIILCVRGNLRFETDKETFNVLPGRLFISRPNEPHRRATNPKGMRVFRIMFKPPRRGTSMFGLPVSESDALNDFITNFPCRMCPSSRRVLFAFERLMRNLETNRKDDPIRAFKIQASFLEILLSVIEASKQPLIPQGRPNAKIEEIAKRMEESPERDFRMPDMAREANLSPVGLIDSFKRLTGLTPHAYLMEMRIRKAREDMINLRLNSIKVAEKYNFPSPQHFSTVFKHIVGMPPSHFMKQYKLQHPEYNKNKNQKTKKR